MLPPSRSILPISLYPFARLAFAVGLGAAVPSLFAGRVPILIFLIMLLIAGGLLLPIPPNWRSALKHARSPFGIALVVMIMCWAVSVFSSLDIERSILAWLTVLGLSLLGPILVSRLSQDPSMVDLTLKILVIVSVFGVLVALISAYLWPGLLAYFRTHAINNRADVVATINLYGSVIPLLLPVVVWAGFRLGGKWKPLALFYIPLSVAGIFAVNSKSGLLGLAGVGVAIGLLALFKRQSLFGRRFLAGSLILGGLALSAWLVISLPPIPYSGPKSLNLPTWMVDAHRQVIWSFSFEHGLDRPFFGHGIRAGSVVPGAATKISAFGQEYVPSHSHSWFFQLILETGFVGLITCLAVLLLLIHHVWKITQTAQGTASIAGWAATAVFGAFFLSALVNFSFFAAWWQTTFVLLFCLCLAGAQAQKANTENSPNKR